MLARHRGELTADIARFYGLTWGELEERYTIFEAAALIIHLPRDSAVMQADGGKDAVWGLTDHLIALLLDEVRYGLWRLGGSRGQKPKIIPRPGVESEGKTTTVGTPTRIDELDEWLGW